jgi:hypothetical protein
MYVDLALARKAEGPNQLLPVRLCARLRARRLERPLSRIVAFGPFIIHLESHLERPLSKIVAFGPLMINLESHAERHLERPLSRIMALGHLMTHLENHS